MAVFEHTWINELQRELAQPGADVATRELAADIAAALQSGHTVAYTSVMTDDAMLVARATDEAPSGSSVPTEAASSGQPGLAAEPFDCVADLRQRNVTPHVAQNTTGRRSAIDPRTTRDAGYDTSQWIRKRIEEIFGWMKTVGGFRRTRYRGLRRTQLAGYLVATAYNLVRMARLVAPPSAA